MSMIIRAPTYTQIPNDLFDHWIPHLKEGELKLLLVIMRKTLGWHKNKDKISLSQLEKFTGLTRTNILNASESLQSKGIILKYTSGKAGCQETYYELVINEDSNNSYQSCKDTPPSPATISPPVLEKDPQKKQLNKTIVCFVEPVAQDSKLLKKCSKKNCDGQLIEISFEEIIQKSILMRKDWEMPEIEEAWKVLVEYQGPIREWFKFMEGTIKNIRNTKKTKQFNQPKKQNQQKKEKISCQPTPLKTTCEKPKEKSLENDTRKQQLQQALSKMGLYH